MLGYSRIRATLVQVLALVGFCTILIGAAMTAWVRIQEQGMAYGFGVLMRPTGWNVSSILVEQGIGDPYWWTLTVATINTVLVSMLGIILATVIGFVVGILRHAGNPLLSKLLGAYVEVFRNVPLLLQLVFWYTTFTRLPPAREAIQLAPSVWLSNAGLNLPAFSLLGSGWLALAALVAGATTGVVLTRAVISKGRPRLLSHLAWTMAVSVAFVLTYTLAAAWLFDFQAPEFGGFNFRGGIVMPVELFSLIFAIMLFSSAYVAEVVRGGLQSVPSGQWEAADSMSLTRAQTYLYVALPITLRSIIPSLGNQYVFIVKATSLGIAVGFSDLFSVSVVSITQSGQTLEFLAILMVVYLILNYSLSTALNLLNRRISLTQR